MFVHFKQVLYFQGIIIFMNQVNKVLRRFSTVNEKQMSLFRTLTNWWHPSGPMQILYSYNYHRIAFLKKNLPVQVSPKNSVQPLLGMKILDVGCGAGFLSESMARLGGNVTGLDPNPTSFNEAVSHKNQSRKLDSLEYFNRSLEDYQSERENKQSFDLVTSMEVIEHVDQPQQFLQSIASSVKPGGLVMLSTIQRSWETYLTHILLAENLLRIVPQGTHHHEKFINLPELEKMMKDAHIEPIDNLELDLNWKGQFIERRGGGNYLILGRKLHNDL